MVTICVVLITIYGLAVDSTTIYWHETDGHEMQAKKISIQYVLLVTVTVSEFTFLCQDK